MIALGFEPSLPAAVIGYIVSVIFLIVSPFLRGLGAIEISMSFILVQFGFDNVSAIAITFLYGLWVFDALPGYYSSLTYVALCL